MRSLARLPRVAIVFNRRVKHVGDAGYEDEAEFDSPSTIDAIAAALSEEYGPIARIEAAHDAPRLLASGGVDVVFNIAEGRGGRTREAQIPAICDFLGIEHTAGDATAIGICHDKHLAKKVVSSAGLRVAGGVFCKHLGELEAVDLRFPAIVKPNAEGSSKGIGRSSVVRDAVALRAKAATLLASFPGGVLCEEYVSGREITIGLLADESGHVRALPPIEVRFDDREGPFPVYSLAIKSGEVPFVVADGGEPGVALRGASYAIDAPARLDPAANDDVIAFAIAAFRALSLRDVARIDLRLDANGPCFIEANPLPGLVPSFSDLVIAAASTGMGHAELVRAIARPAVARWRAREDRTSVNPADERAAE